MKSRARMGMCSSTACSQAGFLSFEHSQFSSKGFLLPQDSGNYTALTALTRHVIHFQKTINSTIFAFKSSTRSCRSLCGQCVPWNSAFRSWCFLQRFCTMVQLFLSSSRMGGYFLPNTKDKLLWRKTIFLMKTQCGSQKFPSEEKGHI